MKPIIIHSKARAELDEAIAYYEQQKAGLGLALQSAIERTKWSPLGMESGKHQN